MITDQYERGGGGLARYIWLYNYYLPLFPQFGQLVQLFSDVEIQDLKVTLELRILYILYKKYIYNSNRPQIVGILEEIDSF